MSNAKDGITVLSEVSRGHSNPETSRIPMKGHTAEVSKKGEGLNVRKAWNLTELMKQRKQQKRIRALLV
jgi:hypothetical protein